MPRKPVERPRTPKEVCLWKLCEQCQKFRRVAVSALRTTQRKWLCRHNPDQLRNKCRVPEEHPLEEVVEYMELKRIRTVELFNKLDADNSRTVSLLELKEGIGKLGVFIQDHALEKLFAQIDDDNSGEVNFKELNEAFKEAAAALGRTRALYAPTIGTPMNGNWFKRTLSTVEQPVVVPHKPVGDAFRTQSAAFRSTTSRLPTQRHSTPPRLGPGSYAINNGFGTDFTRAMHMEKQR